MGVPFSEFSSWGMVTLFAVLLISMLTANLLKKSIEFFRNSLIPTSVLGGIILLIVAEAYSAISGVYMFDTEFFGGNGGQVLELLTYHSLALGFIASALKTGKGKTTKERGREIFDTGVTTVSTYLLQAVLGLGITIIAALIMTDFFSAAGILLPFGYGQGTGQALNYGTIYETDYNFTGGAHFGLTIAALGFISASIGGVIHLNVMKRKGKYRTLDHETSEKLTIEDVQSAEEISLNGSIDKMTIQIAFVFFSYFVTFLFMYGLSKLIPSLATTLFGFNFLFGVLIATLVKFIVNKLRKKNVIKKQYVNNFLMNRISGFFFDLMVIAGIAAIRLETLRNYYVIIIILGVVGAVSTYLYNRFVAKKLFPNYSEEQFLAMYGMLTGTASTGVILLREIDKDFTTPAADNLVYQQIPAIAFGFPMMLLATFAPKDPYMTLGILAGFFVIMNLILFRRFIFKRGSKKDDKSAGKVTEE